MLHLRRAFVRLAPAVRGLATKAEAAAAPRRAAVVAAATAGIAAFGYQAGAFSGAQCGWWPFGGGSGGKEALGGEWDAVRKELEEIISAESAGPLLVRLAWHASGTWDLQRKNGGSNGGLMRFSPEKDWGANRGLDKARAMIEPIKAKHPTLSYADLYTFAGKVACEYMGGVMVPWKPGRADLPDGKSSPEDGRLPDAMQGATHIRAVFGRMGFNDREMVALIGAHTLGACHKDVSGFVGPWTRDPNGMDNSYFTLLLDEKWVLSKKNIDPPQFEDAKTGELMMLPADMALLVDPSFRKYVDIYAQNQDAWQRDFAAAFGKLLENGVPR